MKPKDLGLELLVRRGKHKEVFDYVDSEGYGIETKFLKTTEASIYSKISSMEEDPVEKVFEDVSIAFSKGRFEDYFLITSNVEILEKIVDVLEVGTYDSRSTQTKISAFEVLDVKPFADAIRRNIDGADLRESVSDLIEAGYSLVFDISISGDNIFDKYFAILDQWRDYVDMQKVVQEAVNGFYLFGDFFKSDNGRNFVYNAIDKLIEMTDRDTVSKIFQTDYKNIDIRERLIADGKIDRYSGPKNQERAPETEFDKALDNYQISVAPDETDVESLDEVARDGDKVAIAERMGVMFGRNEIDHVKELAEYKGGILYDHDTAKKVITEGIVKATKIGDLKVLDQVLDFPAHLIDMKNPEISGFVKAYQIMHKTEAKE